MVQDWKIIGQVDARSTVAVICLTRGPNLLLDGTFISKPTIHPIWRRDAHSSWGINASRIRQSDFAKPEEATARRAVALSVREEVSPRWGFYDWGMIVFRGLHPGYLLAPLGGRGDALVGAGCGELDGVGANATDVG